MLAKASEESWLIIEDKWKNQNLLQFNISVLAMDIVNKSKEATSDLFRGNNNEQDILNTQLAVVNKLIGILRQEHFIQLNIN